MARTFAAVIKLRILSRETIPDHMVGPKSNHRCPERKEVEETSDRREESHIKQREA